MLGHAMTTKPTARNAKSTMRSDQPKRFVVANSMLVAVVTAVLYAEAALVSRISRHSGWKAEGDIVVVANRVVRSRTAY